MRTSWPQSTSLIVEYWWEGAEHRSPIVMSWYLSNAVRKAAPSVVLACWHLSTHRLATASRDAVHGRHEPVQLRLAADRSAWHSSAAGGVDCGARARRSQRVATDVMGSRVIEYEYEYMR